jgi:hypothetical protein
MRQQPASPDIATILAALKPSQRPTVRDFIEKVPLWRKGRMDVPGSADHWNLMDFYAHIGRNYHKSADAVRMILQRAQARLDRMEIAFDLANLSCTGSIGPSLHLTRKTAKALSLFLFENLTRREIAERLHTTPSAVKLLLQRARRMAKAQGISIKATPKPIRRRLWNECSV